MSVHPSAIVASSAALGADCEVGPYVLIEAGVVLGDGCVLASHAVLRSGTVLGEGVRVDSFSVLGGAPQSFDFEASITSGVRIGNHVTIREGCTVNRATESGAATVVGDNCYLMAQAHVAHDCELGEGVTLCNNTMLGGHVVIADKAFIGGGAGIHQFCRIGARAMIGGNASISVDVPPYTMAANRNEAHGLNVVGLRRAGFDRGEIADLKRCYRAVFTGRGNFRKKAEEAMREHEFGTTVTGMRFLNFFENGGRGFIQPGEHRTSNIEH